MKDKKDQIRILKEKIYQGIIYFFTFSTLGVVFWIFIDIFLKGIPHLSLEIFLEDTPPPGVEGGGIRNALVGTLLLIFFASLWATPWGILVGIYLAENKESLLSKLVRLAKDNLQGIPSIIYGLVAYTWAVLPVGNFHLLSGSLALGFLMLPVVVTATEESILLLPRSLKEAGLSLGVSYYRVLMKVVLPAASSGILTGFLLALSRITGETAPLLFTSLGNPFLSVDPFKPVESLPHIIYVYGISPFPRWHEIAWASSTVLIFLVFFFYILSLWGRKKWKTPY